MIHPDAELRWVSEAVGWGVFAGKEIPRGSLVWVKDSLDQVLTPEQVESLPPILQRQADIYGFTDARGDTVLCWDLGRFVNHHCAPSSLSSGLDFDVAIRTIPAGGEITTHYAQLNLDRPFHCLCGWRGCENTILPADFERHAAAWDRQIGAALQDAAEVRQPLWSLVANSELVLEVTRGDAPLPSVMLNRYVPARPWPVGR